MGIKLDNRVAIITGGALGIGRATALAFAKAGAGVAVWDLAEDAGQALVTEIRDNGGEPASSKSTWPCRRRWKQPSRQPWNSSAEWRSSSTTRASPGTLSLSRSKTARLWAR